MATPKKKAATKKAATKKSSAEEAVKTLEGLPAKERIDVAMPKYKEARIPIVGLTPLLTHCFNDETKLAIIMEQIRKAEGKKAPPKQKASKSIEQQASEACYVIDPDAPETDGRYGFPANAFRLACGTAAGPLGIKLPQARQLFLPLAFGAVPLRCSMRKDRIDNVGGNYKDPTACVRSEFFDWSLDLFIEWDSDIASLSTIVSLLERAGRAVGVGAWRPACNGLHGRFRVGIEGE